MKTKKDSALLVFIALIGIIYLSIYLFQGYDKKDTVVVLDYDSNGNVIKRSEVQLAVINNNDDVQATVSIPSQYSSNYIRRTLDPAPSGTISRHLIFTTYNVGNVDASASIKNAKYVGTFKASPIVIYNPRNFSNPNYAFDYSDSTAVKIMLIGHTANTTATYYLGETFPSMYINTVKIIGQFKDNEYIYGSGGNFNSNMTLQYYDGSTWKDSQVICTNSLPNGLCSGTGTYTIAKTVSGIRLMMKLYGSNRFDFDMAIYTIKAMI